MALTGPASRAVIAAGALVLGACTTVLDRHAAPDAPMEELKPYGIGSNYLRAWGDTVAPERARRLVAWRARQLDETIGAPTESNALALSGGGPDGAFGAGVLAGWSARGDRPAFSVVTGVSTGAIVALFAFLGPERDATLREIYSTYRTDDLLTTAFFSGLTGGAALTDNRGYRELIDRYVSDDVVEAIAKEYEQGRLLLIGTTNLDAARPVIWNIGEIAASGDPRARDLIRDVIEASSAIPAVFPPVLIPVEHEGRRFDEMHVDGGATQQVMMLSPGLRRAALDAELGRKTRHRLFVIINNKLKKRYDPVRPRLGAIAERALGSLISGSGSGDLYRLHAVAERDGVALQIMSIPRSVDLEPDEPFDPEYMKALYQIGFDQGRRGKDWASEPPDFSPKASE